MKNLMFAMLFLNVFAVGCKKDKHDDENYEVNTKSSLVLWKGSTSATSNTGSFDVTSTSIVVNNNRIISGTFKIPIATIKNFNLPDDGTRAYFINHLKSADFFNPALHPNASFKLSSVNRYVGNGDGAIAGANQFVTGEFTMLDKTQTVSFPANIQFRNDSLKLEAKFNLDRTRWGMNYASDPNLGEHYINKDVEIQLKINAGRN